jgi:DNA-directed RNA polymerase specialized sigma24 family protein
MAGLSYGETASTLAIPVGTVMSRLHRGRTRVAHAVG